MGHVRQTHRVWDSTEKEKASQQWASCGFLLANLAATARVPPTPHQEA